jgi:hypothetical protein
MIARQVDLDQACQELHNEADLTGADPRITWLTKTEPSGELQGTNAELTVRVEW